MVGRACLEWVGEPPRLRPAEPGAVSWTRIGSTCSIRAHIPHDARMVGRGRWSGEEDLGGVLCSGVGASSWAANRLDCFAEGTDSRSTIVVRLRPLGDRPIRSWRRSRWTSSWGRGRARVRAEAAEHPPEVRPLESDFRQDPSGYRRW